jgi:hypothetical protein
MRIRDYLLKACRSFVDGTSFLGGGPVPSGVKDEQHPVRPPYSRRAWRPPLLLGFAAHPASSSLYSGGWELGHEPHCPSCLTLRSGDVDQYRCCTLPRSKRIGRLKHFLRRHPRECPHLEHPSATRRQTHLARGRHARCPRGSSTLRSTPDQGGGRRGAAAVSDGNSSAACVTRLPIRFIPTRSYVSAPTPTASRTRMQMALCWG